MPVQNPYQLISTKKLIKIAQAQGFDFGRGNPNNRLRYWTKIGLLPHAIRKQVGRNGYTQGHYPAYTLDLLNKIQLYKQMRLDKKEVKNRLQKEQTHYLAKKTGITLPKRPTLNLPFGSHLISLPLYPTLSLSYCSYSPLPPLSGSVLPLRVKSSFTN